VNNHLCAALLDHSKPFCTPLSLPASWSAPSCWVARPLRMRESGRARADECPPDGRFPAASSVVGAMPDYRARYSR